MDVSIIIVSWNVKKLLNQCLNSIFRYTHNIKFEVFVIDNNSTDGTVEMIKKDFPNIICLANQNNFGFAKANNQGIRLASGKYFLLLNPDTMLIEPSINIMVDFMNKNIDADIAGCQLLNSDKTLQQSVRRFPTIYSSIIQLFKIHHIVSAKKILRKYLYLDFNYSKTQRVDQVMGAFLIYRKELGLLDEKFYLWLEEVDLCKRAKKVYYTPQTKIIHFGGCSFRQVNTWQKQKFFYKSLWHYFYKHGL